MRPMIFACIATFALAGCMASGSRDPAPAASDTAAVSTSAAPADASSAARGASAELAGTYWRFFTLADETVPATVNATLRFGAHGHVSGHAGCNSYGAKYTLEADGTLHVGAVMSTKMACLQPPGAMRTEHAVFAVLEHAVRLERNGDTLTLLDAAGKSLATLHRQALPSRRGSE